MLERWRLRRRHARYLRAEDGLQFRFQNANNHQLTFGVINTALVALTDWVEQHEIATCTFYVFDGENQVGEGVFEGL